MVATLQLSRCWSPTLTVSHFLNHCIVGIWKSRDSLLIQVLLPQEHQPRIFMEMDIMDFGLITSKLLVNIYFFLKLINMPNYLLTLYSSFDYLLAGMEFHLIVSNLNRISFSMILLWNCVGWAVLETLSIDWLLHGLKKLELIFISISQTC